MSATSSYITMCIYPMQGPEQVMNAAELHELLGCDVVPLFKVVFAQMAASCAAMTRALHQSDHGQRVMCAFPVYDPLSLGQLWIIRQISQYPCISYMELPII